MVENQFDSLGDLEVLDDVDQASLDSLYDLSPLASSTRRFSFILFEEIVEISPAQSREIVFDPESIPEDKELLESIRRQGILQPIIVREIGKGSNPEINQNDLFRGKKYGERTFALVAGHRRVEAGKAADLKGVEGIIAENENDHELITLAENMGRRELSTFEKALAIRSLKEERSLSIRKTGDVTGLSIGHLSRLITSLDAPPSLRDLWRTGKLNVTILESLKSNWEQFETELTKAEIAVLCGINRAQARDLNDQLAAGTDLPTALKAIGKVHIQHQLGEKNTKTSPKSESNQKQTPPLQPQTIDKEFKKSQKKAIIKAIRDVFPDLTERQVKKILNNASSGSIDEIELIWAGALFVSRGGDLDEAIDLAAAVMANRKYRTLILQEIKQMKKVSHHLLELDQNQAEIRQFLTTIFVGA